MASFFGGTWGLGCLSVSEVQHWETLTLSGFLHINYFWQCFYNTKDDRTLGKLTRQKRKNVAKGCSRLMMWRGIICLTSRKNWSKKTMYSEAISARTPWFVIWVRQLLLAQQVKPLQLITAHWTAVVCPASQTPVAHPLRLAHCLKMSPRNTLEHSWAATATQRTE